MNKNFISLCAGILLGVSPLFAVPAKPVLVRVAQPDGTVVTVKTVGDEFYHYKSTSDDIPVVRGDIVGMHAEQRIGFQYKRTSKCFV